MCVCVWLEWNENLVREQIASLFKGLSPQHKQTAHTYTLSELIIMKNIVISQTNQTERTNDRYKWNWTEAETRQQNGLLCYVPESCLGRRKEKLVKVIVHRFTWSCLCQHSLKCMWRSKEKRKPKRKKMKWNTLFPFTPHVP